MVRLSTGRSMLAKSNIESDSLHRVSTDAQPFDRVRRSKARWLALV